jgi:hypothetical protein
VYDTETVLSQHTANESGLVCTSEAVLRQQIHARAMPALPSVTGSDLTSTKIFAQHYRHRSRSARAAVWGLRHGTRPLAAHRRLERTRSHARSALAPSNRRKSNARPAVRDGARTAGTRTRLANSCPSKSRGASTARSTWHTHALAITARRPGGQRWPYRARPPGRTRVY